MATPLQRKTLDLLMAVQAIQDYRSPIDNSPIQIWGSYVPDKYTLPFLLVRDENETYEWVPEFSRIETHTLTVRTYGHGPTIADAFNEAEAVMDLAENAIDWEDIMNQLGSEVPGCTPISTVQTER